MEQEVFCRSYSDTDYQTRIMRIAGAGVRSVINNTVHVYILQITQFSNDSDIFSGICLLAQNHHMKESRDLLMKEDKWSAKS